MKKFKILYPQLYAENFKKVPYDFLWEKGIRNLLFDIDNTLAIFTEEKPSEEVITFLTSLKNKGFSIAFISNNGKERVEKFSENLSFYAVYKAGKPRLKGINMVLSYLNAKPIETALIGDQIFTDVWCANRAGVFSILTKPLANRDEFTVKLKRLPEKVVLKTIEKSHKRK
ncbi:MAG: YqeG family HAD IIIA-type phosphatase [Defluviitaleaceae bacterium]|nr:YqeG family HAD IIIA-type phosphatase [Defluviitaleaceae bacterium]